MVSLKEPSAQTSTPTMYAVISFVPTVSRKTAVFFVASLNATSAFIEYSPLLYVNIFSPLLVTFVVIIVISLRLTFAVKLSLPDIILSCSSPPTSVDTIELNSAVPKETFLPVRATSWLVLKL